MLLERNEFISKGASLATICVTQPRRFCALSPNLTLLGCLFGGMYTSGMPELCCMAACPDPVRDPGSGTVGSRTTDPGTAK